MACVPSTTRFPRSTILHVQLYLTIPRAIRRTKPQTESRRIPLATKQPQQLTVSTTCCSFWRTKSSLPPITNLRSHSRRPTPGYQHILFTTVSQSYWTSCEKNPTLRLPHIHALPCITKQYVILIETTMEKVWK